jgi:hypothetical protein
MNVAIFWDVAPRSPYVNRLFGGKARPSCCTYYTLVSCSANFLPWRWRWYVLPKRRFTYRLQGSISQMMATFITDEVFFHINSPLFHRLPFLHSVCC